MGVSCYCGCATWQNRIKWSLSLTFLAVGGDMFMIASVILALKTLNCEQNVLTPSERGVLLRCNRAYYGLFGRSRLDEVLWPWRNSVAPHAPCSQHEVVKTKYNT